MYVYSSYTVVSNLSINSSTLAYIYRQWHVKNALIFERYIYRLKTLVYMQVSLLVRHPSHCYIRTSVDKHAALKELHDNHQSGAKVIIVSFLQVIYPLKYPSYLRI